MDDNDIVTVSSLPKKSEVGFGLAAIEEKEDSVQTYAFTLRQKS
jgi:hypothetical protein